MHTVFHITHWKAGSQWIRRILETVAPHRIVEPRVGEGQVLLDPIRPGGVYPTVYLTQEQFLTVNRPSDSRHFVVIRDLRDTLVSSYFSFRHSHKLMTGLSAEMRQRLVDLPTDDGMMYLLEKWLQNCASIMASWLKADAPMLRYRDLLERDVEMIGGVLIDHCGLEVDRAVLRQAIINERFENKAKGRTRGAEDVSSHERKGVAGDWRDKLSPQVLKRFEELFGSLNEAAGYEPSFERRTKSNSSVKTHQIEPESVIEGFTASSAMYPQVLPLNYWLGFEYAALRKFDVSGRVLDVNCRDGRFFRTVFPGVNNAEGVASNPLTAELAVANKVYTRVHVTPNYEGLSLRNRFDTVLANGVVGAGAQFPRIIATLERAMKREGRLICSVRTDKFRQWLLMPRLFEAGGCDESAKALMTAYLNVHATGSLPTEEEWCEMFESEDFEIVAKAPVMPEFSAELCLFIDALWHLKPPGGEELGGAIASRIAAIPGFSGAFGKIVEEVLRVEQDSSSGAGLILEVRLKR